VAEPLLDVELAQFLKDEGFGDLYSDNVPLKKRIIHVGEEPDEPTHTITVLEDAGGAPVLTISESRSFTIQVRNEDYEAAKTEAQQIHRALHEEQGILSTVLVARVTADTNPLYLGRDENKRHRFSQAFTALVKRILPS
jgi:hypothetical protein